MTSVHVIHGLGPPNQKSRLRLFEYATLVRYAVVVMVRVWYVGTLFELKIPDFSHIAPAFCVQRLKTAEADAKCVN